MKPAHMTEAKGKIPKRKCHDCGQPTWDYRCRACWQRLRGKKPDAATKEMLAPDNTEFEPAVYSVRSSRARAFCGNEISDL